jgi:electron-transferring-flavoprotein dehydrogenase
VAKVTVFGDDILGQLAEDVIARQSLATDANPQIYSVGVKEIVKLPDGNAFGANHVVHTFGYPLPRLFGGGSFLVELMTGSKVQTRLPRLATFDRGTRGAPC